LGDNAQPVGRLPGIDGQAKMSKSLGNALSLSASPDEISKAVKMMFTDPDHLRVSDPGKVEGNVVFTCLEAFDPDQEELNRLKAHYRDGGLGDSIIKKRLDGILQEVIGPIRERRAALARDPGHVLSVIREGTAKARIITGETRREISEGLGLFAL
jgi:tryptophanyl-tRNA synthetase